MKSKIYEFPKNICLSIAKKAILAIALLFAMHSQAQWGEKITGNGNIISKKVTTAAYDKVEVSGFFDVDLIPGKEGNITVDGEQNLLDFVTIEVVQQTLKIYIQKGKNIRTSVGKGILVKVPFESLDGVSLTGSGDVNMKGTIKTDKFEARLTGSGNIALNVEANATTASMTGSGDLTLKGKTQNLECRMTGSGDLDAYNLASNNVDAAVSGSGNCKVNCTNNFVARVSGSGDISYKGDPKKKDTKVAGSGSIQRS